MTQKWKTYEEISRYIIDQIEEKIGLDRVEGKQKVKGLRAGNEYNIEAKGIKENEQGFVIVECRRKLKNKIKQEELGGLAYRVINTGASGGIIVSPLGLQDGAEKVAKAENIISIQIDPNSTKSDYFVKFLEEIMLGVSEKVVMIETIDVFKKQVVTIIGLS